MRMVLSLAVVFALALVCLTGNVAADDPKDSAFQKLNFEKALAKAKSEKKMLFIDFTAEWCGWCKKLDADTWSKTDVQDWLKKNTIAIKVDVDKFPAIQKKFKVEGMPTMVILGPDGKEVKRIVGYRPADKFMSEVKTLASKN